MRNFKAVIVYVVCDEVLKMLGIQDDSQSAMTHAEVMTFLHPCRQVTLA